MPPTWIYKRDGRLVPFSADQISRSLFAAAEALGRPDAFAARELTDSVLHFLEGEADGSIPTTAQLSELVIKVVRELGHPDLAQIFADARTSKKRHGDAEIPRHGDGSRDLRVSVFPCLPVVPSSRLFIRQAGSALMRDYALREVFTRDLVAAQADGLISLMGLDSPFELLASVSAAKGEVIEEMEKAAQTVGGFLAVDAPEYSLASPRDAAGGLLQAASHYAREFRIALRATGLRAVVNLNSALRPSWADELAPGPLFEALSTGSSPEALAPLADALLEQFFAHDDPRIRVDWHVGERDFETDNQARLADLARYVAAGKNLAFVFDRPRRPISLAEGIDRRHASVLIAIGLSLPRLPQAAGLRVDPDQFLKKLESLCRLALSAAVQKRDFLRRLRKTWPAFLLERARLLVVPLGLEEVVRRFFGCGLCGSEGGLEYARKIIQALQDVLRRDGQAVGLETCLDSSFDLQPFETPSATAHGSPVTTHHSPSSTSSPGLTPWDANASPKNQLKAGGRLHGLAQAGTIGVILQERALPQGGDLADWLGYAWRHTEVVRMRLVRPLPEGQQLTAPWEA